jgi:hypothetical protein
MQPYFFPHLQHFALIDHTDRWVVLDVTQYTPKTWMNRNRVLNPTGGCMYITIPVQGSSQSKLTRDIVLHDPESGFRSITGKLEHYRRLAPYYREVVGLVERAFSERAGNSLVALDAAGLRVVCEYLSIDFEYAICSELGLDYSGVEHAGQWSLRIAEQLAATEYLNPVGGAGLFLPAEFDAAGIRLRFLDVPPITYHVPAPYGFMPSLSIIDVLMWNGPRDVTGFIRDRARILEPQESRA